ncbi:hypothetical protein B0H10DRAFT_1960958 [Mycena sp. CBHHK59/15]|nr:hypothetical protein B0H10DRAFT_1960958 [Mycena sp. CBHHK59/15]
MFPSASSFKIMVQFHMCQGKEVAFRVEKTWRWKVMMQKTPVRFGAESRTNGRVNYTEDIPGCGVGRISKQWLDDAAEDPCSIWGQVTVIYKVFLHLCQQFNLFSEFIERKDLEVEWPMSAQNEHPYGAEVSRSIWGEIIVGDSSHWKKEHLEVRGCETWEVSIAQKTPIESGLHFSRVGSSQFSPPFLNNCTGKEAGWVTVQPFNQPNPPLNGTGQHVPLVIQVAPAVNQPIQSYTRTGFTKGSLLAIPHLSVPSSFR